MVPYSLQIFFIRTISFNCHNKYFRQISSFSKDDTETLNLTAYSWEKFDFNPASFYSKSHGPFTVISFCLPPS